MYGLVNRAIQEMVVEAHGDEAWKQVAKDAGIDAAGIVDMTSYDDEITFKLIGNASNLLNVPADELLHAFGKHWVLYTSSAKWGYLFELAGNDFLSFLHGMDNLHARVEAQMPESRMPQFTVIEHPDHVELQYRSDREGLAPMVGGLLDGLMDKFDERWHVQHTLKQSDNGYDAFVLRMAVDKSNAA